MKGGGSCSQLTASVPAEVLDAHFAEIDLSETHRRALRSGLSCVVHCVNKNAHPLIARTVRVHCATSFARSFYLNAIFASFDGIFCVLAFNDQIRMSIEVGIDDQRSRVLCKTRCQHVGQHSRHDCRPQRVVKTIKTFCNEAYVDVEEKVIDILNRKLEVLHAQLTRKSGVWIELRHIESVSNDGHGYFQAGYFLSSQDSQDLAPVGVELFCADAADLPQCVQRIRVGARHLGQRRV